jgi:hypothetical protein
MGGGFLLLLQLAYCHATYLFCWLSYCWICLSKHTLASVGSDSYQNTKDESSMLGRLTYFSSPILQL